MARMKERYREEIAPALRQRFEYENPMQIPKITKVVVNMGVGEAVANSRALDGAMSDLSQITGQKPQMRRARKSVAGFKIREGMPVGARVTLRGERMWEFLDRLISVALATGEGLPGHQRPVVRRAGELRARAPGAAYIPGDLLRPGRRDPRDGRCGRDDGGDRRGRPGATPATRDALQDELETGSL